MWNFLILPHPADNDRSQELGFKLNCSEEHERQFSTSRRWAEKQNSGNQAPEFVERKEEYSTAKARWGARLGVSAVWFALPPLTGRHHRSSRE
jgi:hypothetical protein